MATRDASADAIAHNIESIAAFYEHEHRKVNRAQRTVEWLSEVAGRPSFLVAIVLVAALWMGANLAARSLHWKSFDPAPFFWLQGCVSLLALLTTTVVLIRQERLADLEQRREHLDLQVNLLTEQKTTKLIHLIEELRRDMPMVRDRRDAESEMMQQATDPHRVLAGIDEALIAAGDRGAGQAATGL